MSWFYPALAGGSLWLVGSYGYGLQQQAVEKWENASQAPEEKEPFRGAWSDIGQYFGANTRQRFHSVQEDRDVLGATIFLVDYGNGARTIQYHDPRILL